jgi:hypothetical protein
MGSNRRLPKTGDDRFYYSLGLVRFSNLDALTTCLLGSVVIASRKNSVSNVDYFFNIYLELVAEFADAICLINSWFGYIDRCRSSQSH